MPNHWATTLSQKISIGIPFWLKQVNNCEIISKIFFSLFSGQRQKKVMPSWYQLGLFLVLAAKWLGGKVLADDLVELCTNNPEFCQSLLSEGKIRQVRALARL